MSTAMDASRGARRRTMLPMRVNRANCHDTNGEVGSNLASAQRVCSTISEDGRDSGVSSESTTPVNGSPPPRQTKLKLPLTPSIPVPISRASNDVDDRYLVIKQATLIYFQNFSF